MMLELTGEVKDRGADSTPMYNPFHADPEQFNATHSDIQMAQFRLFSSPAKIYLPTFGSPFVKFRNLPDETPELTGTYSTGFCHHGALASGTCAEDPRNLEVDSGVPLPGFDESHWIRSRIRSLPTGLGNEAIVDISTDGGASYLRIGRVLFPYDGVNGSDVENPGLFTRLAINSPGVSNCCKFDEGQRFDEGEYSLGFIKFESLELAPADKGDMDLDGDVDFDEFVQGLNDPDTYRSTFWVEASQNGDIEMDGDQDFDDIAGFVGILSGGLQGVPEPSTFMLTAIGLLGLVGSTWRRRHAA